MSARHFAKHAVLTGLAAGAVVVAGLPTAANATVSAVFSIASSTPADRAIVKTASNVTVCFNAAVAQPVLPSDVTVTNGATPVAGTDSAVSCAAGTNSGVTFTPTSAFTAGDYTVSYSVNDTTLPPSGPATASGSLHFRLDTSAPNAPALSTFTSPVDSANVSAASVTGTAEASQAATATLNADPISVKLTVHSPAGGADVVRTTTTDSSGNYSFSNVDLTSLTDTTGLTYAVQATDSAGNPSSTTTSSAVVKDTAGPALTSSTPVAGGTHQSTKTIALTFGEALNPAASSLSVKNGLNTILLAADPVFSAGNTVMTLTTTSTMTPAGNPYTVSYAVQDALTNATSGSFSFTIDDTAPGQPTSVTLTNPINAANAAAVTVSGLAETGSTDAIDITDGTNHVLTSVTSVAGAFSAPGIDVSSLSDGPISASVIATDAAGNHSTPATANATKDVVAPDLPTSPSVQPDPVNSGSEGTVTVSATVANDVHDATLILDDADANTPQLTAAGVTPDGSHVVSHVFDVSSLTDGVLTGTITAYDAAGNPSAVASATTGKDATAPDQPTVGISPNPVAAGATTVAVSGLAEKSSTVHLTLDDSDDATAALTHDVVADATTGEYSWDFALATLNDGTLTATAVAEDAAGNSSLSNSATAPMDRVAPDAPVIDSAPAYANIANAAAYQVTGHAEPASAVDVIFYDDHSPANTLHKQAIAADDGAWSVTGDLTSPSAFDDGALHLSVTATDAVGNVSSPATADQQKDTAAPDAPRVDSYVHPVNSGNQTGFAISGTDGATEPGAGIDVSIDDGDAGTVPVTASSTASGVGAYSFSGIDVSSLTDGPLTITVASVDVAGNPSATGTQVSAAKDTVDLAPVSHAPDTATTKTPTAVTATYNEPLDPATTTVMVTDKTDTAGAGTVTYDPAGTTVSFTPASPFTEQASPYTVTVTAHDAAGDAPTPLVWSFTVDNTAPAMPVVTSVTNPVNAANATSVSVGGTAEPLSSVAVDLTDGTHHATATVPADGNGAWLAALSATALDEGTLTATAIATDAAGNSSDPSTGVTTTKDTIAPDKPVVTSFTNPVNAANATAIALGGTADANSTVSVDISDGTSYVIPFTTTADGDGNWSMSSVDVSSLGDTTLSAVATATDAAGNVSALSDALTSVKDTAAPDKPVITSLTDPITAANVTAVSVAGTAEPDSAISIDLSDGTVHVTKQATADDSGDWSVTDVDVSSLSDGTVTALATATDAAGNTSLASDGVTAPKQTVVPSAPRELAAAPQDGALDITWTAPESDGGSAVTGYTLTVTPHGSDTPVSTTSPAADDVESTISSLTNGTLYDVALTATNAAGTSQAATASGTPRTVPDAPTGVTITPGDGDLSVSWTAPSDGGNAIDKYTVTANPGNHTVSTADGSTTQADLTGLTNGTEYTLSVVAHNAAGDGTASADATGTPRTVAGAPTGVTITPGDGDLSVSWTAPSVTGGAAIDKYTVTATPGDFTVSTADGLTTQADLTGLANGTRYTLTVVAHNAAGDGAASEPVSDTPRTVPDAPTGVQVTPGDGQLTASWTAPAQDGGATIASYTVTANPGAHTATTADGTTLQAVVSGLTNGTVYSVTVTANNAAGDGAASTPAVTSTPRTVPGAPTGLHVRPGDGAASVSWSAPADGGAAISSYSVTANPGSHVVTTADGATHSAIVSGLTNGTAYTFTVTAHNAAGDGAPSAAGVVTPRYLTSLTITTSKTLVSYGTPITMSGQLLNTAHQPVAGASVVIYRVSDAGATLHLTTVKTNSFGHWTLTYTPGINGIYYVRYFGGTADAASISRKVGTRVAAVVRITSPANNTRTSVSTPLVVRGSVSPNKSGSTVALYYVDSRGGLHKLASTRLSSRSLYAFSVRLGRGTWHLRVLIGNTTNNLGGRSSILTASRV